MTNRGVYLNDQLLYATLFFLIFVIFYFILLNSLVVNQILLFYECYDVTRKKIYVVIGPMGHELSIYGDGLQHYYVLFSSSWVYRTEHSCEGRC